MNHPSNPSVVVASFSDLRVLSQCLDSLKPQCDRLGAEVVLVRPQRESAVELARVAAGCRIVLAPAEGDIPRVRGMGLASATGEWVVLTEDHCVADDGWLQALMAASGAGAQVIGGSMRNARHARAVDCGAYFAEYGIYGGKRDPKAPPMIAAANVAYHRSVLPQVVAWCSDGEWENVIHDRLYEAGYGFRLVPEACIRQNQWYSVGTFLKNRFQHGCDYARARSRTLTGWRRAALMAGTPLLPPILAARIAHSVDTEERKDFRRALPATLAFLSAWAFGEAAGYALGGTAR